MVRFSLDDQMTGFRDIQNTLDRVLGDGVPNHGPFWRSVTRDEFIEMSVYGLPIIVDGDPEASNLVRALRGLPPFGSDLVPPPPGAFIPRMPAGGLPPASEEDIARIEQWIRDGCPEMRPTGGGHREPMAAALVTDQTHVEYWRAVDDFFLPNLSTEETAIHVGRMHVAAFQTWAGFAIQGDPLSVWEGHLADTEVWESFEYVRHHQRRLIIEFYGGGGAPLFESLWRFGGDLLPLDPDSNALPKHTMNGVLDWFFWVPQLDATLRQAEIDDTDLDLARAWQMGIVADGLVRDRFEITEFSATDPDLPTTVKEAFWDGTPEELVAGMISRAQNHFGT